MFKRILLAYDGSPEYRSGLRQGADLAQFAGAEVHLLAIITSTTSLPIAGGVNPSDLVDEEQKEIQKILEEGVERLRKRGIKAEGRVGFRDPVDEIADTAREINADLIVVGHRRRSAFHSWWRKSMSKSLLSVAPCSVLVSYLPGVDDDD
jgi:nucleotide-binding universal stress UspA family protein